MLRLVHTRRFTAYALASVLGLVTAAADAREAGATDARVAAAGWLAGAREASSAVAADARARTLDADLVDAERARGAGLASAVDGQAAAT